MYGKEDTASGKADMFMFQFNKVYFVPRVFHTWDLYVCCRPPDESNDKTPLITLFSLKRVLCIYLNFSSIFYIDSLDAVYVYLK